MEQTTSAASIPVVNLPAMAAQRFPLVPRVKPPCRTLEARATRVRDLARLAGQHTDETLVRAAEAHNLAALIASDCGMPGTARKLCWRQARIFLACRPYDSATAKLALQQLVNLGRLLVRDGDGDGAYRLLTALYEAVRSQADASIDGTHVSFAGLTSHAGQHREVVQWLWAVLLADGTRALTRASRWLEALHHAERHHGIGQRLFDGRQVAVLAHCSANDHDAALSLLATSVTPTPWEKSVAACLQALCRTWSRQPPGPEIDTMTATYLSLAPVPEHAIFRIRLGLCAIDLAGHTSRAQQLAQAVVRDALDAADAYAAREVLAHPACMKHTAAHSPALREAVQAAGLGLGTMPARMLDHLMESVADSETSLTHALREQEHTVPRP